jgi:hypothetical protein
MKIYFRDVGMPTICRNMLIKIMITLYKMPKMKSIVCMKGVERKAKVPN